MGKGQERTRQPVVFSCPQVRQPGGQHGSPRIEIARSETVGQWVMPPELIIIRSSPVSYEAKEATAPGLRWMKRHMYKSNTTGMATSSGQVILHPSYAWNSSGLNASFFFLENWFQLTELGNRRFAVSLVLMWTMCINPVIVRSLVESLGKFQNRSNFTTNLW